MYKRIQVTVHRWT